MKRLHMSTILFLGGIVSFTSPAACLSQTDVVSPGFSCVSISSTGQQAVIPGGYSGSFLPSITADGRYVVFESNAENLVPGDSNSKYDVFVRDRIAETTERVSVSSSGIQGYSSSGNPSITTDGRYVAFSSHGSNLVAGDSNRSSDIFVRDRIASTTERISVSSNGIQGYSGSKNPSISADGSYVAFASDAVNLVAGDSNRSSDIFVRDRIAGTTELVSISSNGIQGYSGSSSPSISADGSYVAFASVASDLVAGDSNASSDIFVRDRIAETTERVSVSSTGNQGYSSSSNPSISADGHYMVFESNASNLVVGDSNSSADIFIRSRLAHTTELVSVSSSGSQGNHSSRDASISPDGRYVTFASHASNLVANDNNEMLDVFIHDRNSGQTICLTCAATPISTIATDSTTSVTSLGQVAFNSAFAGLVINDTNLAQDIFVSSPVFVDRVDPIIIRSGTVISPITYLLREKIE